MSSQETGQITSPVRQFTFGPMVVGVAPAVASAIPQFFPGCSKVIGMVRTVSGGVVGQPYLTIPAVIAGAFPVPLLVSGSATDTSTYTMYFYNQIATSQGVVVLPC